MLSDSGLEKKLWAETLNTATLLSNVVPTRAVNDVTPYQAFRKEVPDLSNLRVFGCAAYAVDYK